MSDYINIRVHQQSFLNKAKARKIPITIEIEGVMITVNPGVFPPATDTKLLVENIHTSKGERIIDLTTGSGSAALIAGLQGASGIATDINKAAVINANQNFSTHKVQMKALESDLFGNVASERFDQMFVNGPFFEGDIHDPMDYACYGARSFIEKLFVNTQKRLKKDGKLLIVLSQLSDLDHFNETVNINKLSASLIKTKHSEDKKRVYNLYEVKVI